MKYTEEYQAQYKQRALKSKINGIHQAYMNLAQFKLGDTKDPQHINDQLKRSHEYIDSLIKTDGELDTAKIKECKAILKKEIDISQKLVDDKQATVAINQQPNWNHHKKWVLDKHSKKKHSRLKF